MYDTDREEKSNQGKKKKEGNRNRQGEKKKNTESERARDQSRVPQAIESCSETHAQAEYFYSSIVKRQQQKTASGELKKMNLIIAIDTATTNKEAGFIQMKLSRAIY